MVWQYRKLDALLLVPTNNNFVYRNKADLCRNNGTAANRTNLIIWFRYRKVASSRLVYYSILELFGQRSQYISLKFLLHKPSENLVICY